ncbi:unnamed protein product [Protopolystoma xenopodis]|uniref:Uncharacterized protein n=1 Tax=Protopolystoma xenopodis TaxID=117903 RepID=A0A448WJ68_9PLAT|nr:unnamed protein product [Protopolystoma xenopodis]
MVIWISLKSLPTVPRRDSKPAYLLTIDLTLRFLFSSRYPLLSGNLPPSGTAPGHGPGALAFLDRNDLHLRHRRERQLSAVHRAGRALFFE